MTDKPDTPARDPSRFVTVTLDEPLARGDGKIETVTLRKPTAGELRGLKMQDILQADVTCILKLIPRISDPILIDEEAQRMDPADFAECVGAISGFFMTKEERTIRDRMIAEQRSKI